ncbi:MAG: hypothetical protein ABIG68_00250 [Acidobacteriota bacterium]
MQTMTQVTKLVMCSVPKDYNAAAGTIEYISMKTVARLRFIIATGAWAGGTAAVTLKQAANVSGSSSAALAFADYWTGTGDTLTRTTATSNTFNLAAANTKYVIEIKADDLTPGLDCVACIVATPGANADLYCVLAECYGIRYQGSGAPTTITN